LVRSLFQAVRTHSGTISYIHHSLHVYPRLDSNRAAFSYSDTWQLAINTATTIITFLMVFLIQHTQNIDSQAVQIKLDELIRATKGAHNALLDLEEMTEKQLDEIRMKYEFLAKVAKGKLRTEEDDLGSPDVGLQDSE
jgi:low affinity Fe/Cu permease